MSRTRPSLTTLVLIAVVVLISACGSSAPAGSGSDAGTAGTHEQALKFAACMRDNGVSAFPDPPASGPLTIDAIANGSSLDTDSAAFTRALAACKQLEPAGFMGQEVTSKQAAARLEFARCMRDHGVPDFPDPAPNGPLIDTRRIPSLAGEDPRTDPSFNAAIQRCQKFAAAAGVTPQ